MKKILIALCLLMTLVNCTPRHQKEAINPADQYAQKLCAKLSDTTELHRWLIYFNNKGEKHAALIVRERYAELLRITNRIDLSIYQLDTCILNAISLQDTLLWIKALDSQGMNLIRLGAQNEAGDVFLAAQQLLKQVDSTQYNTQQEFSRMISGLGYIEMEQGELDKAKKHIYQAMLAAQETKDFMGVIVNLAYMGSILDQQGKKDSAAYYIQKCFELSKKKHFLVGLSLGYKFQGHQYKNEGKIQEAIECYKKSYQYALSSNDLWNCHRPLEWLCFEYQQLNQTDSALKYVNEDIRISQLIKSKDDEGYAWEIRASVYEQRGDYRQGLEDLNYSRHLYNSGNYYSNLTHINNVRKVYTKQTHELVDRQRQIQVKYREKLHIIHTSFLFALLIAICVALFFALRYIHTGKKSMQMQLYYNQQLIRDNETLKQQVRKAELANMSATIEDQKEDAFLNNLNNLIVTHIQETELNSNTLAPKMHISPSSLAKKIKGITGMNARAYVLLIRIEKAKKLLRQTDLPMSDIQVQCGFETQSHFSRAFAEQVGMPPSKYRKAVKKEA